MDAQNTPSVPPELQVLLDADIHLENLTAASQSALQSALAAMPGIESITFFEQTLSIRYDPEKITKVEWCATITQAGLRISAVDSAPPMPPIDDPAPGQ